MLRTREFILVVVTVACFYQLTNAAVYRFTAVQHKSFIKNPERNNYYVQNSKLPPENWNDLRQYNVFHSQDRHNGGRVPIVNLTSFVFLSL